MKWKMEIDGKTRFKTLKIHKLLIRWKLWKKTRQNAENKQTFELTGKNVF